MFRRKKNKAAKAAKQKGKNGSVAETAPSIPQSTENDHSASVRTKNQTDSNILQPSSSQAPNMLQTSDEAVVNQNQNETNSEDSEIDENKPVVKERPFKSFRSLVTRESNSKSSTKKLGTSSSTEATSSQPTMQSEQTDRTKKTRNGNSNNAANVEKKAKPTQVNYDVNPTLLYKFIEYKDWNETLNRIRDAPEEANIWVYRLESYNPEDDDDSDSVLIPPDDKIRWKMLPIHVAIIFNAPIKVILALHKASPTSLKQCDDRKMLPIHLACRVVSNVSVTQFLLYKNPKSLEALDYKGRTPLDILKEYGEKEHENGGADKIIVKNRVKLIRLMEEKLELDQSKDVLVEDVEEEETDEVEEKETSNDETSNDDQDEEEEEEVEEEEDNKTVQTEKSAKGVAKSIKITRNEQIVVTSKEVDYDTYPTVLIKLIEKKLWEKAIDRCSKVPQEASIWMCRLQEVKNKGNSVENEVRWKILPIHSAIVLHAPVEVIEALVDAYPKGLQQGDDRQMLPLHMAFRLGSSPEAAAVIVDAFPEALKKKDARGHTPLHILKAYRKKYIRDRANGKKNTSDMDANRKKLIKFYLGGRRYGESTEEHQPQTFDSDSDSDYDSSDDESYYDSDDDEGLFYTEMFKDFAKLTSKGISSFPHIMRDTLACRGGSYDLGA